MPTTDDLIDETRAGCHARREGVERSACPHDYGTSLGNAWRRGWDREDLHIRMTARHALAAE